MDKKEVSIGVKIISILYIIFAIIELVIAILLFIGASAIGVVLKYIPILSLLGSGLLILVSMLVLGIGLITFFSGLGLWKRQKWARIVVIIFSILGFLRSLLSIIRGDYSSIVGLLINSIIGGYLIFNKNVKSTFS